MTVSSTEQYDVSDRKQVLHSLLHKKNVFFKFIKPPGIVQVWLKYKKKKGFNLTQN